MKFPLIKEKFNRFEESRKHELIDGKRKNSIPNAQLIMWSIVKKQGISVEFITADFADSVAALASHLKADILSKNWNLANYAWAEGADVNVFYHWKKDRNGRLQFKRNVPTPEWRGANPERLVPARLPGTSSVASPLDRIPASIHVGWTYIRGCGSNQTHLLNPHIKVTSGHNI